MENESIMYAQHCREIQIKSWWWLLGVDGSFLCLESRKKGFTETINEFDNKPLLKLGEQSEIEFSTQKLPFEKVKELVKQSNSFTKISEISNISVGEQHGVVRGY